MGFAGWEVQGTAVTVGFLVTAGLAGLGYRVIQVSAGPGLQGSPVTVDLVLPLGTRVSAPSLATLDIVG